jgi:hypothetical protein
MWVNNMRTASLVLCGMMLVNAPALYAAEQATAATPAPDISEDQTAEEMLAAEAALEAQQAAAASDADASVATDAAGADASAPDERTPGIADEDFVPSIQISEDLSVSFPVDI